MMNFVVLWSNWSDKRMDRERTVWWVEGEEGLIFEELRSLIKKR